MNLGNELRRPAAAPVTVRASNQDEARSLQKSAPSKGALRRRFTSLLWCSVIAVGVMELVLHVFFAGRAPPPEAYAELRPLVAKLKRAGDFVVAAPGWAEPLVRSALGDALMPLSEVARPDNALFERAIEVSSMGQSAPELAGWKLLERHARGEFELRVYENPAVVRPAFAFVDHVNAADARVFIEPWDNARSLRCGYTRGARSRTGGLHGAVAFPTQRFRCPGGEHQFVGVTLIDDQDYKPRRCIWAHPSDRGKLVIRFPNVPLGGEIFGYAGLSYFLMRDGMGTDVKLEVRIDGAVIGSHEHRDESGWAPFRFPLPERFEEPQTVDFVISSERTDYRHFCFYADSR